MPPFSCVFTRSDSLVSFDLSLTYAYTHSDCKSDPLNGCIWIEMELFGESATNKIDERLPTDFVNQTQSKYFSPLLFR